MLPSSLTTASPLTGSSARRPRVPWGPDLAAARAGASWDHRQAPLVLVRLRKGETFAELATGSHQRRQEAEKPVFLIRRMLWLPRRDRLSAYCTELSAGWAEGRLPRLAQPN
jgi:hypothetical protein